MFLLFLDNIVEAGWVGRVPGVRDGSSPQSVSRAAMKHLSKAPEAPASLVTWVVL